MKVYKFLDSKFGMKSILERRLKISRINELNDPFELFPYDISDRNHRFAIYATKNYLNQTNGVLCFSGNWQNPVLWAHYSDKHYGLCIEFEVPDNDGTENDRFTKVRYVSYRRPFPQSPTIKDSTDMLFTKFSSWQYEDEVRALLTLKDEVDGLYYADFSEILKPTKVIVGLRCTLSQSDVINALGSMTSQVDVIKARAGFKEFKIVKDERGFR
ncbi:MAG TPA: DUF2971 domain-containing protein [Candidatus Angelobacter sp.]|jgi:hypothetical protein